MKLDGEQRIEADRAAVWRALNDPDILQRSIPGCETLVRESGNRFNAVVAIKVGPIGARFKGAVELSDMDEPSGYTLSGEGQGGVAGSAKGSARVSLIEDGAATRLTYTVDAQVSGRLAQLGGAIIEATARQLAGRFFARFAQEAVAISAEETGSTHSQQDVAGPVPMAGPINAAPPGYGRSSPVGAGWSPAALLVVVLAAYVLGVFQARADLWGSDSLVVLALLVIVAIASRLIAGMGHRSPDGSTPGAAVSGDRR